MADRNLNDDMVKLVEYTIVSIERDNERTLAGPEQVMETDNLTGDAFSNARIAEWVGKNPTEAKSMDTDTLRVYYSVLERWPKEDLKYEEKRLRYGDEQVRVLREIRDAVSKGLAGSSPAS